MRMFDCEILILGAGPAGLSAALAAARCGKSVMVLDDNPRPGGQIWRDGPQVSLPRRARRLRLAVAEQPRITLLNGARLIARPHAHSIVFETADGCGEIRWQRLILCCGARELSLPFPGWTLPGVTGAGGLQAQIKHGLSLNGERVIIAGSGPLLLAVASTVKRAGGNIVAIIEQAPVSALARFAAGLWRWPEKLLQLGELFPAHYHPASQVIRAQGVSHLHSVSVRHQGNTREIACDRLAIGYGLVPNLEPGLIFGCKTENQAIWVDAGQRTSVPDIYAAGECTGFGGSELALAEGEIAGYIAANNPEKAAKAIAARARWQRFYLCLTGRAKRGCHCGYAALPLRGCALRRCAKCRKLAGGEARITLWDGCLPGKNLRHQRPLAVRLAAATTARAPFPRAYRHVDPPGEAGGLSYSSSPRSAIWRLPSAINSSSSAVSCFIFSGVYSASMC